MSGTGTQHVDSDRLSWYVAPDIFERMATAAIETKPEWVIEISMSSADEIMNRANSAKHDQAYEWLGRAKAAFLASGRQPEWEAILEERIDRHKRKYKMLPLLEALRD